MIVPIITFIYGVNLDNIVCSSAFYNLKPIKTQHVSKTCSKRFLSDLSVMYSLLNINTTPHQGPQISQIVHQSGINDSKHKVSYYQRSKNYLQKQLVAEAQLERKHCRVSPPLSFLRNNNVQMCRQINTWYNCG